MMLSMTTGWALLVVAGMLEGVWAPGLKCSAGFTKMAPQS